jgi:hypothetical protein
MTHHSTFEACTCVGVAPSPDVAYAPMSSFRCNGIRCTGRRGSPAKATLCFALKDFCDLKHMTVNVQKTQIVFCRLGMLQIAPGSLQARPLGWSARSSTSRGLQGAVEVKSSAATKAMWSVMRQA